MSDSTDGPLARWSRRKLAARQETRARTTADPAGGVRAPNDDRSVPTATLEEDQAAVKAELVARRTEETADAQSGDDKPSLPPLEELDANSDYTPFLAKGVPEEMTRAALRKLWLSDPIYNRMDGLDTYIQDFNVTDEVITAAQTDYKAIGGYFEDEASETKKDRDQVAAASSQSGTESRDTAATEVADEEKRQIDAGNTSARPGAGTAAAQSGAANETGPDKLRDKSEFPSG